jgi:hypothetical protein
VGLKSFIITLAHKDDKVVVDVVGTNKLQNEPFLTSKKRELIQALKGKCNLFLLDHFKNMVSSGFLMSQLGMAFITTLKL